MLFARAVRVEAAPIALIFPPNAALLALLMLVPAARWWAVLLPTLPVHFALQLSNTVPLPLQGVFWVGNCAQAALGAWVFRRATDGVPRLDTQQRAAVFLLGAAAIAPAVASVFTTGVSVQSGWVPDFWPRWSLRTLSNLLSVVVFTPVLLALAAGGLSLIRRRREHRSLEAVALLVTTFVTGLVVFGLIASRHGPHPALIYAPLPLFAWAAVRFGPGTVSGSVLVVALLAISGTLRGRGPLSVGSPVDDAMYVEAFLAVMGATFLYLAAVIVERETTRRVLANSESRYRHVVEAQTELVCRYLPDTTLTFVNEAYCRFFGRTREQLIGTPFLDLIPPESRHFALEQVTQQVVGRETVAIEHPVIRADGTVAWQQWIDTPIFDDEGRLTELQGIGRDITERRLAEQALTRSQERYALATAAGRVSVFDYDAATDAGTPDPVLPGSVSLDGEGVWSHADWVRRIHPDDVERVLAHERGVVRAGAAGPDGSVPIPEIEYRVVGDDEAVHWRLMRGSMLRPANGGPWRVVGTVTDITQRKRDEAALQAQEAKYHSIFEGAGVAICELDYGEVEEIVRYLRGLNLADPEAYLADRPDLAVEALRRVVVRDVNRQAVRLFGAGGKEELVGRGLLRLLPDAGGFAERQLAALVAGRRQFEVESTIPTPDRGRLDVVCTLAAPRRVEDLGSVLLSMHDITERKRAERALQESEQRYRTIVRSAAVAILEEDFTRVAAALDGLRAEGVSDLATHLRTHPDAVRAMLRLVRITDANAAALALFGVADAAALTGSLDRLATEESYRSFTEELVALSEGRTRYEADLTVRTAAGEPRDVLLTVVFRGGALHRVLATMTDVTELRRATEAVRESEAKFRGIFESNVIAIALWSDHWIVREANDAYLELVGRTREQLAAGEVRGELITPPEYAGRNAAALGELRAHGVCDPFETEYRRPDGTRVPVLIGGAMFPDGRRGVGFAIDLTARRRAEQEVVNARRLLQSAIDSLSANIAILDETGTIVAVNEPWRRFGRSGAVSDRECGVGQSYLGACEAANLEAAPEAPVVAVELRALLGGKSDRFHLVYRCPAPHEVRWFHVTASRFGDGAGFRVVLAHEDITELKRAEETLQQLTGRLLQSQDDERRRIARELHDLTAQDLFAITINLARLQTLLAAEATQVHALLRESRELGDKALREIRTLSYLLHPPLLDQAGLLSALQWYVDGFVKRSGIGVELVALPEVGRLPRELETALFRIVQESLTNIHRHSRSSAASIHLSRQADVVRLKIEDYGVGLSLVGDTEEGPGGVGVGIAGMRERVRQLGGRLEVASGPGGTAITATVPVPIEAVA